MSREEERETFRVREIYTRRGRGSVGVVIEERLGQRRSISVDRRSFPFSVFSLVRET
jgi:hypothetical protein